VIWLTFSISYGKLRKLNLSLKYFDAARGLSPHFSEDDALLLTSTVRFQIRGPLLYYLLLKLFIFRLFHDALSSSAFLPSNLHGKWIGNWRKRPWYNFRCFFFNLCGGTLGAAVTTGLLYQPRMTGDDDCGEIGGMKRCYFVLFWRNWRELWEFSLRIAGLWGAIWIQDLRNTMQDCYSLSWDVQCKHCCIWMEFH
jgi:hypothetical protein